MNIPTLEEKDRRIFRLIQAVLSSQNADALRNDRRPLGQDETEQQKHDEHMKRLDRRALVALRDLRELILREAEVIDIVLSGDGPHERFVEIERKGKSIRLGWDVFRDGSDGDIKGRTIRFSAILPEPPDDLPLNEENAS